MKWPVSGVETDFEFFIFNVTRRPERVYKYQVSHYSILEAKVGNDKFPGFMFVNKGKIVISKKDMYSINKLEMGHSRN